MFDATSFKFMSWSVQNVDFWKTAPIRWDKGLEKASLVSSKWRWILGYGNFALYSAYTIFLAWQCIWAYLDESTGTSRRILAGYYLGTSFMPLLYHSVTMYKTNEFVAFINAYTNTLKSISEDLLEDVGRRPRRGRVFVWLLVRGSQVISYVDLMGLILRPWSPNLLSTLVAQPKMPWVDRWKVVPFAIVQVYLRFGGWSICRCVAVHLLSYMNAVAWISERLRLHKENRQGSSALLNRIAAYRQLQVLHAISKDTFGRAYQGQKLLCTVLVIRSLYGVLITSGPQKIRMAIDTIAHLGYLNGLFKAIANANANSKVAIGSWKSHANDNLSARARRACTPLTVDVAGLYNVDHSMMLTLWSSILDGTVNLLLTGSTI